MIKAGIIGATGYAGAELVRLLTAHPEVKIAWYGSRSYMEQPYADIYGSMFEIVKAECDGEVLEYLADSVDVIFTATPQGYLSAALNDTILNKVKIVDLSADYRIRDVNRYEAWYKIHHATPQYLEEAVYGLCEINRDRIRKARLIANPGCFPTCSVLSLYPLVKEDLIDATQIIIDAKSGTSGAGRGAKTQNLFCEVNESIKAYGVTTHRHTPEIEDQIALAAGHEVTLSFTPHLVPMNRGILVTAYAPVKEGVTDEMVRVAYQKYYQNETFVRVLEKGKVPETRYVKGSNYADVNAVVDRRCGRAVIMGAIDNLVKGAAGQAVQNMNIMFGFDETEGLMGIPMAF